MSIVCTICIGDVRSETSSLIPCGHLFHKHCIDTWIDADPNLLQKFSCPICKSRIPREEVISPVYFSSNSDISESSNKDLEEICKLKNEVASLMDKRNRLELKATHAAISEEIWKKKSEECEEKLQSLKYFKQLKRISDLDSHMALPTTQSYLDALLRRPRSELVLAIGGIKGRCATLTEENDRAIHRVRARTETLKKRILELRSSDGKGGPLSPNHSIKREEASKPQNVVVIDLDDNSDVEELPYTEAVRNKQVTKESSGQENSSRTPLEVDSDFHSESSYLSNSDTSQGSFQLTTNFGQVSGQRLSRKRLHREEETNSH
ncbi:hypothetical protein BY458DRAFT_496894 [Sporodiniella umbellata]|nr:hypothetical protein BY458DRAFT_496894 [Sporodiniella umbellata]